MKRIEPATFGSLWGALILAVVAALILAPAASAQAPNAASAEDQYEQLTAPSGPAAGIQCVTLESTDGILNEGDFVEYPGDFSVAPEASVVIEDADGTQGTLLDGDNAEITANSEGNIEITVTGAPLNVVGGDGVMNDTVCDSIVASTGISADSGAEGTGAGLSVLPDTGGSLPFVYLGVLLVAGSGLLFLRRRASRG